MMDVLPIHNPFGAPVYYKEMVTSTMDEARLLSGETSGTVIVADEQSAGRGRSGRSWKMNRGENLSFTIMLHYPCIGELPPALTLRTGLAVALAIEDFASGILKLQPIKTSTAESLPAMTSTAEPSPLTGRVLVKWPNDVMLLDKDGRGRKAVGILTEAENTNVYIGIGVNVAQSHFPQELADKACSIGQILLEKYQLLDKRFILLEKILFRLFSELNDTVALSDWKKRLEERMYMKGQKVRFVPGLPEELTTQPVSAIEGTLLGVAESGGIRIVDDAGEIHSFVTGELKVSVRA